MTETEQQQLFKRVRRHFPRWNKRQCSGYVHGINDHERGLDPSEDMIAQQSNVKNLYARGYRFGYADAHGPDPAHEHWYPFIPRFDYRWWEK